MKRFIALLALVSGLLLVDAKADDTKEWCVSEPSKATEQIALYLAYGFPAESITGFQAQAYLIDLHDVFDSMPKLPGVEIIVAWVPGKLAQAFIFKGDKYCARITLPWKDHVRAWAAAKGEPI